MTITRKSKSKPAPKVDADKAAEFIHGAESSEKPMKEDKPTKKNKVPVALRFDPDLLDSIDAMASRRGMSRNAIISYWASKGVEGED